MLTDIDFKEFDWNPGPNGDFRKVDQLSSIRGLIVRWLLTEPSTSLDGLVHEESEMRRKYSDAESRRLRYNPPRGQAMRACLPWDTSWGAGIKRYLAAPITPATLAEVEMRVRVGLKRLQGVRSVDDVQVSGNSQGRLVVLWRVRTEFGLVEEQTVIRID